MATPQDTTKLYRPGIVSYYLDNAIANITYLC